MFSKILDFIYSPARCGVCKAVVSKNGELCPDCWNKLEIITNPKCIKCGYPFPVNIEAYCPFCLNNKTYYDYLRSFCVYNDFSKKIILQFKYNSNFKNLKFMGNALISLCSELVVKPDIIIPMPLSYKRLFQRGYNQAYLLAKPVAKYLNLKIDFLTVKRKHKEFMGHKTYLKRLENIKNVFSIKNNKNIKDKNVLIIDDVFTTGASLNELAKTLKKNGAKSVSGLVFCRTVNTI